MSILVLLIAIGLIWKFMPSIFEFFLGMFVIQLIWQVLKLVIKIALVAGVILLLLHFLIK